jgi:hypothetical protein
VWHHYIQYHQVGRLFQRPLEALDAVAGGDDVVPFKFEIVAQASHHVGLVLYDKNFGGALHFYWLVSSLLSHADTRFICCTSEICAGNLMMNLLPCPGALCTATSPP